MKTKKLTYIEKIILLLIIAACLLALSFMVLLIIAVKTVVKSFVIRLVLSLFLMAIPVSFFHFIKIIAVNPLRKYKNITEKFLQGQVYNEFINEISILYPGFEEVINYAEKALNDKHLSIDTKRRSEFLALQNQINPHFLYNTLEAIRGDALSEGIDYIANLANICMQSAETPKQPRFPA